MRVLRERLGCLPELHPLLLVTDADGRTAWLSDALRERCGLGRGDATPECRIERGDARSGESARLRAVLRDAGGAEHAFEGRTLPLAANGAAAPWTICILRPEARRAGCERSLREAVDYLAAILDSAPEAVLAFDHEGFITYANAAVKRLLGRAPAELAQQPIALFVDNRGDFAGVVEELRSRGEVHGRDVELRILGAGTATVSISARPLRPLGSPDAPEMGWVAFLRDVADRKRMEAELERKNAELEHYVQTVSHDLRSPLVSLLGFSRLLRQDYADRLDETGRHFLSRMEQAGRTMETLLQDLLELSRVGRRGEERGHIDPRPVLLQLQAELKPRLDQQQIALELPASPPLLLCDRTRLYQVFSNLIGNAVDHMGAVPQPRIEVMIDEEDTHHRVRVRDNGRGIPPEEQERIFELFHSSGRRSDGARASGVGLAIVKKIAETHGGRVWVESEPGHGATFHFLLPRS